MTLKRSAACLVFALSTSVAQAQQGQGALDGMGLRNCSDFITAKDGNPDQYRGFAVWLSGFISAANAFQADTFDYTPWQPIEVSMAQIAQYCAQNPETGFAQATVAYLTFLRPDRLKEPSELVSLRNGETAVFVYQEVLDRIRALLKADGLLDAEKGQAFDAAFGEAILAYQKRNGLLATGLPDTPTLLKLFQTRS